MGGCLRSPIGAREVEGPKEGPTGMRRDPRSGRSPDASLNSQGGKKKWEDALGHLSEPEK